MSESVVTLLKAASLQLKAHGIETATLDARLLLQAVLDIGHAEIVADPNRQPNPFQLKAYQEFLTRRLQHEPVAKILGVKEFYGREFSVSRDVLDPRADTETLIDAALPLLSPNKPAKILDLGSGSGAIIVTLLCERELATGVAVDLSLQARHETQLNAKRLNVVDRLSVVAGPWFHLVKGTFDLIVSNPPYIREVDILGLSRTVYDYEPHLALDGGPDGLRCYRDIAQGAMTHLAENGQILLEIGVGQAGDVAEIFGEHGFQLSGTHRDLAGHVRVLAFKPH